MLKLVPLLFPFLVSIPNRVHADYGGYDAARTAGRGRTGGERDPLILPPNLPHKPNEYEGASHLYWHENQPFPHAHGGYTETYGGKLHQHQSPYDGGDLEGNNFITDPPGVGLNAAENRDNYKQPKPSIDFDVGENTATVNPNAHRVHPTTAAHSTAFSKQSMDVDLNMDGERSSTIAPSSSSPSSSLEIPYNSAHATEEKVEEGGGLSGKEGEDTKAHVSAHELESSVSSTKRPCCPCCAEQSKSSGSGHSPSTKKTTIPVPSYIRPPTSLSPSYVNLPSTANNGAFYSSNGGTKECGGSFGFNSECQSSFSCGCQQSPVSCCPQLPTCCLQLPQFPCCPRIEFPCCPQQPLCCQPTGGCGVCRSRSVRARRVKRLGCVPCAGRRKRDVLEEIHVRRKRLGCVPCLRRKKREEPQCVKCSPFARKFVSRVKRSFLSTCSPCANRRARTKRESKAAEFLDSIRTKRANDVNSDLEYDSVLQCDRSCCDYSKCIKSKPLKLQK